MPVIRASRSKWVGGLAEWTEGDVRYISIAFTWLLDEAYTRAIFAKACGLRVVVGGPALFLVKMKHILADVAEIRADYPDAIARHNPAATIASRGCPVGCYFCIVPAMEGKEFTLLPDFPVRPVLCDNNLSALPGDYQDHILERYRAEGVKLTDANSGFEPMTFTDEVYLRWRKTINEGGGPWRFAYDETAERTEVLRVMRMLQDEPQKRKRVYVLVGNEPYAECMARIEEVIGSSVPWKRRYSASTETGCDPHVQAYMKLNALEKTPNVRFDWTVQRLKNLERWANKWGWKKMPFEDYDRHFRRNAAPEIYDEQQGLFV